MKTLIKILCLSVLWFSCESSTEPQENICNDETACNYNANENCYYDYNQCGECTENIADLSCLFGDWASSNESFYITLNEMNFILINSFTCSGISGDFNTIEFPDTCLNTNYSFELGQLIYSFKLLPDNHNRMLMTFNPSNMEDCLVDTLIKMESEIPCD